MSENEYQMLMTFFGRRLEKIDDNITASRVERMLQIESVKADIGCLRVDVQSIAVNGCAHREEHDRNYADIKKELLLLRSTLPRSDNNCKPVWSEFFGSVDFKSKRLTGMAAIFVALAIGWVIITYWPFGAKDKMEAKAPAVKVVSQSIDGYLEP